MRDVLKPALILFVICVVVTAILAGVVSLSTPMIEARTAAEKVAARKSVLPDADNFTQLPKPDPASVKESSVSFQEVWKGDKAGTDQGLVCTVKSRGYDAAGVVLTVGIKADGTINGVVIVSSNETPGLGTVVLDKAGKYMPQYPGKKPAGQLSLVKNGAKADDQIDAVAGATITSRAVLDGVNAALDEFRATFKGATE